MRLALPAGDGSSVEREGCTAFMAGASEGSPQDPLRKPPGTPQGTGGGSGASGSPSVRAVVGSIRTRLGGTDSRGRPMSVYGILAAGVTALLILLLVIYLTASDRGDPDQPICTTISPEQASLAVRDGQAEKLTIAYDDEIETPTSERWGPVLARLDYADGQCANLPQGIANQPDVYEIVGVINVYNEITENTQVQVVYERSSTLNAGLFVIPTEVPTATVPPPATVIVTPTPEPVPTQPPVAPPVVPPVLPPATPHATPAFGTPEVELPAVGSPGG